MYIILWRYKVRPENLSQFESAYGPAGRWVQLFKRGEGFISTELLHYSENNNEYLTIDRWNSREASKMFLANFDGEYKKIDFEMENLTLEETFLGSFESIT
ncbi:MAG: antibiotic biosynthesis monooxygenase [Candidatus Riflebacteria bacterium]|nr:antibiotic biosynthesis monooxygenase [Candidatus Riflebacteria bacterium]